MRYSVLSLLFCLVLFSCNKNKELERDKYIQFIESEESEMTKIKPIGDIEYIATVCPVDYMIAKEFKTDEILEKNYTLKKKDLEGFHYFKLRIRSKNKNEEVATINAGSEQLIKDRFEYFAYGFEENIYMIRNNKKDTIPVALYHFERTYGVVPYLDFLFSFKSDSAAQAKDNQIQILINDNVFNNGILTYEFDKKKFNNAPKLKLY